jgi:predicted transcriptional regulator
MRGLTVADHVVSHPAVHGCGTTVGELRALFLDDHVHMALLLDGGRLVSAVERQDLNDGLADEAPASLVGTLVGRAVRSGEPVAETLASMRTNGRRRLAVISDDGALLGLLCLKASGLGFCSDDDVASRRLAVRVVEGHQRGLRGETLRVE